MDHHSGRTGPVALQLWTVRDAMASNADEALRRVKAAGFAAVELAPLPQGLTPERLAESLTRHDLSVVSIHADLPTPANIEQLTRLARECRCSRVIWHGWPRDPRFDSLAGVRDLISACNEAGAIVRDHGLRFGMHNHWWEFEPVEGDARYGCSRSRCTPTSSGNWTSTGANGRRRPGRRALGIDGANRVAPLEGWAGGSRRADDGARAREGRCPAHPPGPGTSG